MSDAGLTLAELFVDLASNGLRLVSCTMNGQHVASFTTSPVERTADAAPPSPPSSWDGSMPGEPAGTVDALEQFLARKERRDQ